MFIGFEHCQEELFPGLNEKGVQTFDSWLKRPGLRETVVPFVTEFRHEKLFEFQMSDYEQVVAASGHALGDVQSGEQMKEVENYWTPYALQHLFHDLIETKGILPTWEDFSSWVKTDVKSRYLRPLLDHFGYRNMDAAERLKLGRAIRWRLGKFYYSAMREIELMIRVKQEFGIQLRYHLLADVLLRVDFWSGRALVCVWFSNPKYRSQDAGRKVAARTLFNESQDGFQIVNVEIERQGWGNFWRASDKSIMSLGNIIKVHQ